MVASFTDVNHVAIRALNTVKKNGCCAIEMFGNVKSGPVTVVRETTKGHVRR